MVALMIYYSPAVSVLQGASHIPLPEKCSDYRKIRLSAGNEARDIPVYTMSRARSMHAAAMSAFLSGDRSLRVFFPESSRNPYGFP